MSDYWGRAEPSLEESFYGSPLVRDYLFATVTGQAPSTPPGPDWVERFVVETYLADAVPVARCLSLACGLGEVERRLARLGVFRSCLGLDVSEQAVARARVAAAAEGLGQLEYEVADLNEAHLPPESADLVWANGALHHLRGLEHAVEQARAALRPGGFLVANEYVGPPRQDFPPRQRELVNALLHVVPHGLRRASEESFLPAALRHRPRGVGGLYLRAKRLLPQRGTRFGKIWDRDRRHFERLDPTEGVRSDEILPILRSRFADLRVHPYNGALLPYVLERRFYREYDERRDRPLLGLLVEAERVLTDRGEVGVDHAIVVARKPL